VVLLGALAGLAIFLGLPIARLRHPRRHLQAFLSAAAAGVLLFLLVDIMAKAFERVADALKQSDKDGALPFLMLALALVVGLAIGLVGLAYYDERVRRRRTAAATPQQIAMTIAIAIGLHNLSEGLAIGQSAAAGKLALATVLVMGFGLHNVTEGFGIAAPIAAAGQGPASWRFLLTAGLVAGAPTFLGTLLGVRFANPVAFVLFLALAAGAIIHVLGELLHAGRRMAVPVLVAAGLLAGFLAGYGADLLLVAGGI
jgi:ZIP family zinc transporter